MIESTADFKDLARELLPAVTEAGSVLMGHFDSGVEVERKSDDSPVTIADQQAEAIILRALAAASPGTPVVAEEEMSAGRVPDAADAMFLVDPLDGTRAFIKGRREFTVNIGLVKAGKPVFGIVYAPAHSRMFVTLGPASVVEMQVPPEPVDDVLASFEPRPVNTRPVSGDRLTVVTSWFLSKRLERTLSTLPQHQHVGIDSSLKFGLVACGEADVYPRLSAINEWDTAAGAAVLRAAGGCVTTTRGEPLTYGHREFEYRHQTGFIGWSTPEPTDLLRLFANA